jgi:hypothetical protein
MSSPKQPADHTPPAAPRGANEPANPVPGRPPTAADEGFGQPIIDDDWDECQANPADDEFPCEPAEPLPPREWPRRPRPPGGKRTVRQPDKPPTPLTGEQRLLLLDAWRQ